MYFKLLVYFHHYIFLSFFPLCSCSVFTLIFLFTIYLFFVQKLITLSAMIYFILYLFAYLFLSSLHGIVVIATEVIMYFVFVFFCRAYIIWQVCVDVGSKIACRSHFKFTMQMNWHNSFFSCSIFAFKCFQRENTCDPLNRVVRNFSGARL